MVSTSRDIRPLKRLLWLCSEMRVRIEDEERRPRPGFPSVGDISGLLDEVTTLSKSLGFTSPPYEFWESRGTDRRALMEIGCCNDPTGSSAEEFLIRSYQERPDGDITSSFVSESRACLIDCLHRWERYIQGLLETDQFTGQSPSLDHNSSTGDSAVIVPIVYRDHERSHGEPLTVGYLSRPETYHLSGTYISKNYGPGKALTQRQKFGRHYVYRYKEVAALSARKNREK